jgi:hypothetical protein
LHIVVNNFASTVFHTVNPRARKHRRSCQKYKANVVVGGVPDKKSRDLEVVVVRRIINLGTGNLEWGGNGKGVRKGRSVWE